MTLFFYVERRGHPKAAVSSVKHRQPAGKKLLTPAHRRTAVQKLMDDHQFTERRACRLTALKLVLVAQSFKNALGGVALFTGTVQIVLHPLVDEVGEPVQLGPLDLRRSLITGRDRKHHHLLHARTRNPEMASGLSFAHTAPTREADLQI